MTPEPMSDERLKSIAEFVANDETWIESSKIIDELYDEVLRLKAAQAIPPDVQAAMEKFKEGPHSFGTIQAALIINWAVSHHGKDGA